MVESSFGARSELARPIVHGLLFVFLCFTGLTAWLPDPCFASAVPSSGQGGAPTTFALTGIVRNQSNQIVSGVRISVTDENNRTVHSSFVESNGRFTVRGLQQGRFTLRIETTGSPYEEYSQPVDLQSLRQFGGNEMIPVDVVLKVKRGNDPLARAGSLFVQDVPKAARTEYERGAKDVKANKTDSGIAALKKAIEIFPNYFDALEMLGTEYVKGNQHELALPLLTQSIDINRSAPKGLYALGVVYLRLNQLPEAIGVLEESAKIDSSNPNTQMMLGLAYANNGGAEKSEAAFKKALQLGGPAAAEAHYYLAGLYNKQEQYRKAWQELDLFLRDSKSVKDPAQIKAMVASLKEKEKTQLSRPAHPTAAESPTINSPLPPRAAASNASSSASPAAGSAGLIDSIGPASEPGATESAASKTIEPKPVPNTSTLGPVPPLSPEYVELLRQAEASGVSAHTRLLDFTYQLKKTHRVLNERGIGVQTQEQIFEAYPIRGEHVLILLSRNGQASRTMSEDRRMAAKQLEEATRPGKSGSAQEMAAEKELEGYITAGATGVYQGRTGYVSINVSTILQSCEFFSPRVETVSGRQMVVLNYRHRAGMKLAGKHAYIAGLVGTVWIDQADRIVARLEGWPLTTAAFDLVQSTAPHDEAALIYQQGRQPDGSWFPTVIRMNAGGRAELFDGLNWDVVFEFGNYQRFNTSASEKLNDPSKSKP